MKVKIDQCLGYATAFNICPYISYLVLDFGNFRGCGAPMIGGFSKPLRPDRRST